VEHVFCLLEVSSASQIEFFFLTWSGSVATTAAKQEHFDNTKNVTFVFAGVQIGFVVVDLILEDCVTRFGYSWSVLTHKHILCKYHVQALTVVLEYID
jgi:hypothetical protein